MRHHDGGVQRGKVQGGDGHVVVAALRFDDSRALEIFFAGLQLETKTLNLKLGLIYFGETAQAVQQLSYCLSGK